MRGGGVAHMTPPDSFDGMSGCRRWMAADSKGGSEVATGAGEGPARPSSEEEHCGAWRLVARIASAASQAPYERGSEMTGPQQ